MILFSHGLGGSRHGYNYVRTCWTARGYATIFLQHPGSDESLHQGVSRSQAVRQLRGAATRKNMNLRVDDVSDVIDAIDAWSGEKKAVFTLGWIHLLWGWQDIRWELKLRSS